MREGVSLRKNIEKSARCFGAVCPAMDGKLPLIPRLEGPPRRAGLKSANNRRSVSYTALAVCAMRVCPAGLNR